MLLVDIRFDALGEFFALADVVDVLLDQRHVHIVHYLLRAGQQLGSKALQLIREELQVGPVPIENSVHFHILLCNLVVQIPASLISLIDNIVEVGEGLFHVRCLVSVRVLAKFQLGLLTQTGPIAVMLDRVMSVFFVVMLQLREEERASIPLHFPHIDCSHLLGSFLVEDVFGASRIERVDLWSRLWLIFVLGHRSDFNVAVDLVLLQLEMLHPIVALRGLLNELGVAVEASTNMPFDLADRKLASSDMVLWNVLAPLILAFFKVDPG